MSDYALLAFKAGAKIIGGCCGTTPSHIGAMRVALNRHPPLGAIPQMSILKTWKAMGKTDKNKKRIGDLAYEINSLDLS